MVTSAMTPIAVATKAARINGDNPPLVGLLGDFITKLSTKSLVPAT